MMAATEDLVRLVGWTGAGAPGVDWSYVESEFGVALPADYKGHVDRFQYGVFQGSLTVLQPRSSEEVEEYLDEVCSWAEEIEADPPLSRLPYPLVPQVPGLYPWGRIFGDLMFCWYLTDELGGPAPTYLVRVWDGKSTRLQGTMTEIVTDAVHGRIPEIGTSTRSGAPNFTVIPRPPERATLGTPENYWHRPDAFVTEMVTVPPTETDMVGRLRAMGLGTGQGQVVDWAALERLGRRLPRDYKRFIAEIGPGRYGNVTVASPNGPTGDTPGLDDVIAHMRELATEQYTNPPPAPPAPTAPMIWGEAPKGYFCGWEVGDFPTDQRPVTLVSVGRGGNTKALSMTGYLAAYLSEGETFSNAPWSYPDPRWRRAKYRR